MERKEHIFIVPYVFGLFVCCTSAQIFLRSLGQEVSSFMLSTDLGDLIKEIYVCPCTYLRTPASRCCNGTAGIFPNLVIFELLEFLLVFLYWNAKGIFPRFSVILYATVLRFDDHHQNSGYITAVRDFLFKFCGLNGRRSSSHVLNHFSLSL